MPYRRISYQSVVDQIADQLGWDSEDGLSPQEFGLIRRTVQRWARFGWEAFFWPEWTPEERRTLAQPYAATDTPLAESFWYFRPTKQIYLALIGDPGAPATGSGGVYTTSQYWTEAAADYGTAEEYDAGTLYTVGARVYWPDTDETYQLHAASSQGNDPDNINYWGKLVSFDRVVAYEQAWEETPLGEVKAVWDRSHRRDKTACPLAFTLEDTGVRVEGNDSQVWMEFRLRCPEWRGDNLDTEVTYNTGDQVFAPEQGDFYRALVDDAGTDVTDPTKWERIDFPLRLERYVVEGVYAALMGKNDGQNEKYPSAAQEAYQLLTEEFDLIERQQSQSTQMNVKA